MRMSPVICAALAVFPLAQASIARSSLDPLTSSQGSITPGNILPAFVSPGRLGTFLSAVREAELLPTVSRAAAEALSARFSDDVTGVTPAATRTVAVAGSEKPYIFEAALFEPSLLHPRGRASVKHSKGKTRLRQSGRSSYGLAETHRPARRLSQRRAPHGNGQLSKAELAWSNG